MAQLAVIPPEVWEWLILPKLAPQDLLSFSKVCIRANQLVRPEMHSQALEQLRIKNGQLSRFKKVQTMLPKELIETLVKNADNYGSGLPKENVICLYPNENHIVLYTAEQLLDNTIEQDLINEEPDIPFTEAGEDYWYSWAGPAPPHVAEHTHLLNMHLTEQELPAPTAWSLSTIVDNPLSNINYDMDSQ